MHIYFSENPKFQKETPAAEASTLIHGAGSIPHTSCMVLMSMRFPESKLPIRIFVFYEPDLLPI